MSVASYGENQQTAGCQCRPTNTLYWELSEADTSVCPVHGPHATRQSAVLPTETEERGVGDPTETDEPSGEVLGMCQRGWHGTENTDGYMTSDTPHPRRTTCFKWTQLTDPHTPDSPSREVLHGNVTEHLTGQTLHIHDGVAYRPSWGGTCLGCVGEEPEPLTVPPTTEEGAGDERILEWWVCPIDHTHTVEWHSWAGGEQPHCTTPHCGRVGPVFLSLETRKPSDTDRVAATKRARQRIADAYYGGVPEAVPMWLVSATLDAIDYDGLVKVVDAAEEVVHQCGHSPNRPDTVDALSHTLDLLHAAIEEGR